MDNIGELKKCLMKCSMCRSNLRDCVIKCLDNGVTKEDVINLVNEVVDEESVCGMIALAEVLKYNQKKKN